jgi:hypothetical protein
MMLSKFFDTHLTARENEDVLDRSDWHGHFQPSLFHYVERERHDPIAVCYSRSPFFSARI